MKEDGKRRMQKLIKFRRSIGITLSALLILIPAPAALAGAAQTPETQEENLEVQTASEVPETAETAEASTMAEATVESLVSASEGISYYESPEGASSALIISKDKTLVISFDSDISGLAAMLEQEGADHIDSLIMASFSDTVDETALKELHEKYPIGHVYASSGHAAVTPAGQLGIKTDYAEYLSVGDENVILYPDDAGNLGVLVFDESSSLFAADTMTNMSVLQDHQEIAYISVLSISDRTGTDEEVISLMNPQACIITGTIPDDEALSSFYNTDIANTQTFYINHFTTDGIDLHFPKLTEIQDAAFLHISIPDPQLFVTPEEETEAQDQDGEDSQDGEEGQNNSESDDSNDSDDSDNGQVSAKQAIAEAALRIWRGEIGQGQNRTNTLRSEGFTDEEMQEIQLLVDKIASEDLGACTAVIFNAGDYADDPDAQIVSIGSTASDLQLSSNDVNYQFTGWYTDKECTEKFDFSTPIKDKTILYAGWEQTGPADEEASEEAAAQADEKANEKTTAQADEKSKTGEKITTPADEKSNDQSAQKEKDTQKQ